MCSHPSFKIKQDCEKITEELYNKCPLVNQRAIDLSTNSTEHLKNKLKKKYIKKLKCLMDNQLGKNRTKKLPLNSVLVNIHQIQRPLFIKELA